MALRLLKGGLETTVYDVSEQATEPLVTAGATRAASPAELARSSDVIGVCVRNDRDVEDVLGGPGGLLAGAAPGSVIAIHSTVLPRTVRELGQAAGQKGVGLLDACVTGGAMGAEAGTLTYMVGGDAGDLEKARPVFETAASSIIHTGELGSGAVAKLCNNVITYLEFLAASEAFHLAEAAGLPVETLESITRSNGNLTDQMQAFLGLHKLSREQRAGLGDLLEGLAGLADKDLASALELASESGLGLPGAEACRGLIRRVYGLDD